MDATTIDTDVEPKEARVLVVDVPFDEPAESASERLSAPYRDGFHIHRAVEWPCGMRVVFVQDGKTATKRTALTKAVGLPSLKKNAATRGRGRYQ